MPVKQDNITPELQRIKAELVALKGMKIHVGIQGSPGKDAEGCGVAAASAGLLTIAGVHEYGATITPKKAKNLAIPIHKDSRGKSPRDFADLDFIPVEKGYGYLVRKKNLKRPHKDDWKNYDWLFMLVDSVTIPERSFIRAGYDSGGQVLEDAFRSALTGIIHEKWTAQRAAEHIGARAVQMVWDYFNTQLKPPKSETTQRMSTQYQPLFESGRLYNSISFTVEGI